MKTFIKVTVLLFFAVFVFVGWQMYTFLSVPMGGSAEEIIFEVPQGSSFYSIANRLSNNGLAASTFKMRAYARLAGLDTQIKVGEYQLNKGMTPKEILNVLSSGKSITRPFTIPEGTNVYELARMVEQKGIAPREEFLKLIKKPELIQNLLGEPIYSLEGYLFPETYLITKYTKSEELIREMVARFLKIYAEVQSGGRIKMSRHEHVILASIVEKETGAPEERPRIASVFLNRLSQKMKLQSDPTIIYGIMDETGREIENITRENILRPTKFNTYTVSSLPFGPISNPGKEALVAVLSPEATDYLYFVSRNDGTHVFTSNYKDHDMAVKKFQLDQKAREGKSWRNRINK